MSSQYNIKNLNINSTGDNGSQQITIRPFHAVTSLNANQILLNIVDQGVAQQHISFSSTSGEVLTITVQKGFTAHIVSVVEEEIEGELLARPYVVKIVYAEDAVIDYSTNTFSPGSYRNEDYENNIGSSVPFTRYYLYLRYNWDEGLLSSATEGEGAATVGRYATLFISNESPHLISNGDIYDRTICIGELLNLSKALSFDTPTTVDASKIYLNTSVWQKGNEDVFNNLRDANNNFNISFNPTGDYVYIGPGKGVIQSSILEIPKGLQYRVRGITPTGISADPSYTPPIKYSEITYLSSGQPEDPDTPGDPLPNTSDIIGQLDILTLNAQGEASWVVCPYTLDDMNEWFDPLTPRNYVTLETLEKRPMSQTPNVYTQTALTTVVRRLKIYIPHEPLIVLGVLRRKYVDTGGVYELEETMWPNSSTYEWLLYRHNPLFPLITIPDTYDYMQVNETLLIPVEEV